MEEPVLNRPIILSTAPKTDNEYAFLFESIAKEYEVKDHAQLKAKVIELFDDNKKINSRFTKWENTIAFDHNKLKEIYKQH